MITFEISFLIGFPSRIHTDEELLLGNQKKIKSAPIQKNLDPKEDSHEIHVSQVIGFGSYRLIPNRCFYDVDIICWGPIAKIFTKDGEQILRTLHTNTTVWIPVSLQHNIEFLSTEEIEQFHCHIIYFTFETDTKKLGKEAKSDRSKIFYILKEDVGTKKFATAYNEDPNQESFISTYCSVSRKSILSDVQTLLHPCTFNESLFDNIINNQFNCKDFIPVCPSIQPQETNVGKKTFNSIKMTQRMTKINESQNVKIPAEIFFTQNYFATYQMKGNGEKNQFFVSVKCENLLTTSQKLILNPVVVNIRKVYNFPADVLKEKGYKKIFLTYELPFIGKCTSIEKPVGSTISFYEAHIFFTKNVPQIKLVEFMDFKRLIIRIYGIRIVDDAEKNYIFGVLPNDGNVHKLYRSKTNPEEILNDKKSSIVQLAVANVALTPFAHQTLSVSVDEQCHIPGLTLYDVPLPRFSGSDIVTLTPNQLNLITEVTNCPLTEEQLLRMNTTLKAEFYVMAIQAVSLIMHASNNSFKSLFMIVFNQFFAFDILGAVLEHNEGIQRLGISDLYNEDIISGFVLDNGNNFMMYFEGPSSGYILNLLHVVNTIKLDCAKVFYNSDKTFEFRLYSEFVKIGGMYFVILKEQFQDILKKKHIYFKGNMPLLCQRAITKFDMLFRSLTLKSILQFNLLPLPEELASLSLEWGIPFRWKDKKNKFSI